jgi:hypothetical protein
VKLLSKLDEPQVIRGGNAGGRRTSTKSTSTGKALTFKKLGRDIADYRNTVRTARLEGRVARARKLRMDRDLENFQDRLKAMSLNLSDVPLSDVISMLDSLMDLKVDARLLQLNLEGTQQARVPAELHRDTPAVAGKAAPTLSDPAEPLSATQLGRALGNLSDETVRLRERSGELFSIMREGRKRGREYPAFEAWPGVAGAPLKQVLKALGLPGGASSTVAYGFFMSPTEMLSGLTPVEALCGALISTSMPREVDALAQTLLRASSNERLKAVVHAAEAVAAIQAA